MKDFEIPAIVLGGGGTTGLGAIRSLGRAGIVVYYMDEKKTEAAYSKYCKKSFVSPESCRSEEALKKALSELQREIGHTGVLFPAADSYALALSDLIDRLNGYSVPAPGREIIEILINKRKFYQSLTKMNVPHPITYFPKNLEDVKEIERQVSYPVFLKPSISHMFSERFRRKGFVVESETELLKHWKAINKAGLDVMIHEIIPGPPTNHIFVDGYIDRLWNPKALFARRRVRMWPTAFGNSTLCISIPISQISSLKRRLFYYLKSIKYHGIFSAEFKKDQRDGTFKLLEINSRTSAWFNTLSAKCGINIMLIAYLDAIGRDAKYLEDYEAGIKWVSLRDDLRSAIKMMLSGDLSSREWLSSLSGEKDYLSYARDDLRPFVMNLPHTISEMI
jgi:D-aspartate ligase